MNQETYQEQREREQHEREERAKAREALQEQLPRIQIDNEVWVSSSKRDDRRNKSYTRTLRVGVTVYVRDWKTKDRLDQSFGQGYLAKGEYANSYWGYVRNAIRDAFAGAPWPCKVPPWKG